MHIILRKSTWLHLRVPFSFFLMPVFLFAFSVAEQIKPVQALLVFICIHFFLYPASNAFNSYFDKDEESIGGLRQPPPVSKELYLTANFLDLIACVIGLFINISFACMLVLYSLVSRAYSHPSIRLKKMPFVSWLTAGFFQGFFTFCMVYVGLTDQTLSSLADPFLLSAALLNSMLLWGSYPMTQIYQHKEDSRRGDITLSLKLGIKGTFYFTTTFFLISNFGFLWFYMHYFSLIHALLFEIFLIPILFYFVKWFLKVRKDLSLANFDNTMQLNTISAFCFNLLFLIFSLFP